MLSNQAQSLILPSTQHDASQTEREVLVGEYLKNKVHRVISMILDKAGEMCGRGFIDQTSLLILGQKQLIEPAFRGTPNVVKSCVKAGTVRRVVLTSSAAAVSSRPLDGDGHVLDEQSWSDVEWLTSENPLVWGYSVSKVLVEKEACKFAEENGISLVTVCPVLTVGKAPVSKVYTSIPASLSLLSGNDADLGMLKHAEKGGGGVPMVHVDDICPAEMFAAEEEAAAGRYLCCSLNTTVAQLACFLTDKYPRYPVKTTMLSGDLLEKPRVCLSSAKLIREGFQYEYKTLGEIYDDVVEYGKVIGILPN
ncbi:hypothetical protein EJB05_47533 [Eragrostis curvula]|uniref:NAD-dependent epimerase/dehydratase domain-containing protein n=1 Tax=Eragrostis curvula TaxID=38414 RepID=A0A5J9T5P9_9POAL|nr:hypothetical protein EJB05_47533 [Eragrostis curvula]